MGGNLTFEAGRPAAGNRGRTVRATPVGSKAVVHDHVTVAPDRSLPALRTARIFPLADRSRQIARINIAKSRLLADLDGPQKVFRPRVTRVGHLVIAVESSDVPGNVGRDAGEKLGKTTQFVSRVVEPRNQKRDDLKPQAHLVDAADAFEDGTDAPAQL